MRGKYIHNPHNNQKIIKYIIINTQNRIFIDLLYRVGNILNYISSV